jgi:nitroreductase
MDIRTLVQQATLAPSGHNAQPWKFTASGNSVRIYPDLSRRLAVVDPDDHALYISLGCALENLVVAAAASGLAADVRHLADCLEVRLAPNGPGRMGVLAAAIPLRQANRRRYDRRRIPDELLRTLLAANDFAGIDVLSVPSSDPAIEPIVALVKEAAALQFEDEAFVSELIGWMRFSRSEVKQRRDGLTAPALGMPPMPRWLGEFIMRKLVSPGTEAKRCEKAIRSSSLLLLFIARANDRKHWLELGQAFERIALTATSFGISHAHLNMPCEVLSVREKLIRHLGLRHGEQPLLLVRLGFAKASPRAPRRPVEEVFQAGA